MRDSGAAGQVPLDENSFYECCAAMANGRTHRQGTLCGVWERTRVSLERCRGYCDEVGLAFAQFKVRRSIY